VGDCFLTLHRVYRVSPPPGGESRHFCPPTVRAPADKPVDYMHLSGCEKDRGSRLAIFLCWRYRCHGPRNGIACLL
jgi:hypothetical protein